MLTVAIDVSEGLCNSFDTTIAMEDVGDFADTDTDSGVHNNSTPDNLDHLDTLETRTNDSLYESLKYHHNQGTFYSLQVFWVSKHQTSARLESL